VGKSIRDSQKPSRSTARCKTLYGCGGRLGNGEHFVHLMKIAAVQNEIERDGDAAGFEPIEDRIFACAFSCRRFSSATDSVDPES